jgi:hypothetical protein
MKLDQEIEKDFGIAAGEKKARKPYRKPDLVKYGKLAQLTAGIGGSNMDHGQGAKTKKGSG